MPLEGDTNIWYNLVSFLLILLLSITKSNFPYLQNLIRMLMKSWRLPFHHTPFRDYLFLALQIG